MNPDRAAALATDEPAEPANGTRRVEIDLDHRGCGRVVVDGRDLARDVSGVEVDAEPCETPEVTLRLKIAERARFDGIATVTVDVETAAVMRFLGWAPPGEDHDRERHIDAVVLGARAVTSALVDRALVTLIAGDRT